MEFSLTTHLSLDEILLPLYIGWSDAERQEAQSIKITLWLLFPRAPLACITDELSDTLCYTRCLDIIYKATENKRFKLLEHLAYTLHQALQKELPMQLEIALRVSKVTLPPNIEKGVSFLYAPKKTEAVSNDRHRHWE